MNQLIPQFILEKYARQEKSGHFPCVSLFADISGFSKITHTLMQHGSEAAEVMANIMLSIFDPLVQQIHQHDGMITTFAGDAFTALFPLAIYPDEASAYQHALAAAVGMQKQISANPLRQTPYGSFPFAIKIGVANGDAEWGILLPPEDSTFAENQAKAAYFFSGPAIQAAASAEHLAQSGNLVLSPEVYQKLDQTVKAIPIGKEGHRRLLALSAILDKQTVKQEKTAFAAYESFFIPETILQRKTYGEFRHVVSVFINLLDVEKLEQLVPSVETIFYLQNRFGGYLNRIDFGDKGCTLLLFWGVPVSHENDVQRALDFILAFSKQSPQTYRAGVTYSPMYVGLAGSAERGEFTAYGNGVNLAARLMIAAPWGSTWISERVALHAEADFISQSTRSYTFKGFDDDQVVYTLLKRKESSSTEFFQGQMVGRRDELKRLADFIQPLFAVPSEKRFCGTAVILGEAGMGKSRLAHELLQTHFPAGVNWFICQTDEVLRQAFNPFSYWLRTYFEQSPTRSEIENKNIFQRKLDDLMAGTSDQELVKELQRTRSCLGALVNLHWEDSLYAQLDPQGRLENTLTALKTLVRIESLSRPLILVLEDIHWLDDASSAFLHSLAIDMEESSLAILATMRSEEFEDIEGLERMLGKGSICQIVHLNSITREDMEILAADRLGASISAELTTLLIGRAEGNPFFAEQILYFLRETDAVQQEEGAWQLVERQTAPALPTDVHKVFTARLDRLTQEVKEVVQTAAILGREFETNLLLQMLHDDQEAPAKILTAEQERIWSSLSQLRYLFKHALLRDAAYTMQLRAHRSKLHSLAAKALETLYAHNLAPHYDKIAYHYESACLQGMSELRSEACHYLELSGRQAAGAFENAAAIDYFSRALALLPTEMYEERFNILLARQDVYHLLASRSEQAKDINTLLELAAATQLPHLQAQAALRQATYASYTGNFPQALDATQSGIGFAQVAQDPYLETSFYLIRGKVLREQEEYQAAQEQLLLALELSEIMEDRASKGQALRSLGDLSFHLGKYGIAREYYRQALALAREMNNRKEEASILNGSGIIAGSLGEYDQSVQNFEQAQAIRHEIGDRWGQAQILSNLGMLFGLLGKHSLSANYTRQCLRLRREINDLGGQAFALNNLGVDSISAGEYGQAGASIQQALDIFTRLGNRWGQAVAFHNLGDIAYRLKQYPQAQDYFKQALTWHRELNFTEYLAEDLIRLAQIAVEREDISQAQIYLDEVLAILEQNPTLEGAMYQGQALLILSTTLEACGDRRGAEILDRAYVLLQERAIKIADEDLRYSFLENVAENREIARLFTERHA